MVGALRLCKTAGAEPANHDGKNGVTAQEQPPGARVVFRAHSPRIIY
jgi:hypothetical protein